MLSTVLQFFASLSLLIVLHEFGHFIAARMFGVRVKKFYLFFDFLFPFPNLANFSLFKKKVGDTEYGIGWFPFGGYVQMAGIMDESMDEEELKQPPKPDEFRSKPAWQRLIILLGGILVNLLLAVVIYTGLSWVYGKDTLPNSALENGYYVDKYGEALGLQNGDMVTKVGDKEVEDALLVRALLFEDVIDKIEVDRNGETLVLDVGKDFYIKLFDNPDDKPFILAPALSPAVGALKDGPLKQSGGQVGDQILAVDTMEVNFFQDVEEILKNGKYQKGDKLDIRVLRNSTDTLMLYPVMDESGLLGFAPEIPYVHEEISFGKALIEGPRRTWRTLAAYIGQFKLIFDSDIKGYKHIGGFGTIASFYSGGFSWASFWSKTAFISIILAFMNLLPIPALDGGHALFTIYEMIARRPPPEKFLQYAQTIGMLLLLFLMLYANGMDVIRWLFP